MKKFQAERSVSHPSTNALCGERLTLSGGRADFFSAEKTPKMQLSSPGNEQVAYTTITRWLTESCRPLITQQRHGRRRHQAESTGNSCACVSHFYIWPFVLDTCHFQLTESIAFLLFFSPVPRLKLLLSCCPPAESILPVPSIAETVTWWLPFKGHDRFPCLFILGLTVDSTNRGHICI